MQTAFAAAATVAVSVLLALAGLAVVRRRVSLGALEAHSAVAGFVYATLGVMYAVIVAQVVVAAWDDYEEAKTAAEREANAALDLFRLAEGFPEPERQAVEAALLAYVRTVIDEEWPAMARGTAPSPAATARMNEVWRAYEAVERGAAGGGARFAASLTELNEMDDARGSRLLAGGRSLPGLMWAALLIGGALTVAFAYFFAVENGLAHGLMVAVLAALMALLLLLVQALNTPFGGETQLPPDGFEQVLGLMEAEAAIETDSVSAAG